MISVTGEPGGRGVRAGVSIADMTAGMYAAFGIMNALRVKEKTGQGPVRRRLDAGRAARAARAPFGGYLADGEVPEPMGTAYKALLPYQTFRTKTKDLALAVGSEKLWRIFCPVIGRPGADGRSALRTNAARTKNRDTLIARLQEVFLTRTYEEWEPLLLEHGIPVGAINTIDQVVEHPQVKARGAMRRDRSPGGRQGAHRRRAGPTVGDAGLRARAGAARWASTPTRCCASCSG